MPVIFCFYDIYFLRVSGTPKLTLFNFFCRQKKLPRKARAFQSAAKNLRRSFDSSHFATTLAQRVVFGASGSRLFRLAMRIFGGLPQRAIFLLACKRHAKANFIQLLLSPKEVARKARAFRSAAKNLRRLLIVRTLQ